jgi:GNAT superfamily N-acetyltransferase
MTSQLAEPTYVGDLGDGLIRRWTTAADTEKVGRLMASVFRDGADKPPRAREMDEARVVMSVAFPFMGPGDFAVVEDTSRPERPLVACTSLFRHQWSYAGIPFGVGRPEEVATDPDYRNRGLIRSLMEMVHARSTAEGHLVQAITGIPYFYRQFGYEYVLDLDGCRNTPVTAIPEKTRNEPEAYSLRLATIDDVPALQSLYNQRRGNSLVWHETTEAFWRYHVESWHDPAVAGKDVTLVGLGKRLHMIMNAAGDTCGFAWVVAVRWNDEIRVTALELASGVNWQAAMPSVLRALCSLGHEAPCLGPDVAPLGAISFHLGRAHPAYEVLGQRLAPHHKPPYAWYLRVPDISAFIRLITPVLEERLARSVLTGHTGELLIDFYRGGLCLQFERGRLASIESWKAPPFGDNAHAGSPALTFLQMLFGYRSLAELRAIFPDVWADEKAALLLDTIFPALLSTVHALG